MPTPRVKYILSPSEIPACRNYVLVTYGDKYEQTRHSLGLTITAARQKSKTVSELSLLSAVNTAREIGKQEGISEILTCKIALRGASVGSYGQKITLFVHITARSTRL
jgi:hypothetical protein